MRPKVLEISWHETQAVYSCDFQALPPAQLKRLLTDDEATSGSAGPAVASGSGSNGTPVEGATAGGNAGSIIAGGRQYRLATAGGDSKVRIWMIHPNIPSSSAAAQAALTGQDFTPHPPRAEYLATLSKHTAAVNVVRFSPNGQMLASAGDDGNVIIWVAADKPSSTFGESADEVPDKEFWRAQKMLQVTTKHVYDLAWSPDSEFVIAGSTDNTATIWKASSGECVFALREHTHNVQGVAWDPLNEYIATQSSDRSVHVSTFAFRNSVPDVHSISRATRMEIRHSRTPSFPSGTRPNLARRGSNVSEAGSAITSASEFTDHMNPSVSNSIRAALQAPATPTASVPSTPQPAPMDPPISSMRPSSRRSSFSGSQAAASPSLSAVAFPGRSGRSPSPIPPLPAIRAPSTSTQAIMQRLYGEEGVTRFFRRLNFSPDGSLLFTPAGQIEDQIYKNSPMLPTRSLSHDGSDGPNALGVGGGPLPRPKVADSGRPTVFIYSRANLGRGPVAHLPGHKTASVAIRFSPVFYDLRTATGSSSGLSEPKQITLDRTQPGPINVSLSMPPPPPPTKEKDGGKDSSKDREKEKDKALGSIFALPYRLLYAVACQDAVYLYDTQQSSPIAIFRELHYAGFTDVAWSPDGQALMLSSSDGYCSIVVFDMAELGSVHATQQHHRQLQAIAQSHSHSYTHSTPTNAVAASTASTPLPLSPAVSTMRQSPAPTMARSEREGSTSSSIAGHSHSQAHIYPTPSPYRTSISSASTTGPPTAIQPGMAAHRTVSSTSSSTNDPTLPTPTDEIESFNLGQPRIKIGGSATGPGLGLGMAGRSASESWSSTAGAEGESALGLGLGIGAGVKRSNEAGGIGAGSGGAGEAAVGMSGEGVKKKRRVALTRVEDE